MSREISARFGELELVARGGMGRVDAAFDPVVGRRVAIKTLREEYADDQDVVRGFVEEARVTGQLEHPNVVPVYELVENEAQPYLVMRLVQGKSLTQLLRFGEPPRSSQEAGALLRRFVEIVMSLCDALSFAHSRGVIHCDLKPDNVMVGEHGQIYLMDWGVAATERSRGDFSGTVAYMAPEQLLGRSDEIDARTDVFGLGAVLYEILTGSPPNEAGNLVACVRGERVLAFTPAKQWSQLPPELCRVTAKALSANRDDRHATVAELRADLAQFLRGGGWFDTLRIAAGETIVREGEPGNSAYIIESGTCEVYKDVDSQRVLVRRLGAGDVFGEAAVFAGGLRTATIVAADDVVVRLVTGEALNRELDENPTLAAFVRSLANLFKETDAALAALGGHASRPPPSR